MSDGEPEEGGHSPGNGGGVSDMMRIIVAGAAGRMGKRLLQVIRGRTDVVVGGAFERPGHPSIGEDAGLVAGAGEMGVRVAGTLEEVVGEGEVLIDFTYPGATAANLVTAASHGLAMVIGTTGFSAGALEEVERLARGIRCVMAPNMSVGVNVMFKVVREMARILGDDYDMEILELHHRLKKDAPSGTAVRLGEIMARSVGRDLGTVGVFAPHRHHRGAQR